MADTPDDTFDVDAWSAAFLVPWNDHDVEGAVETFTEDGEWEFTVGPDPWGTTISGRDALRRQIAAIFEAIPDLHYEPVHLQRGPDHLVMEVLVTGTDSSGRKLNYRACDIVTLAGDRVAAKRSYRKVVS